MKKILAIAVASAIAAPAMADMTITGTVAYGWTAVDYEAPTTTVNIPSSIDLDETIDEAITLSSNDTGSGFGVDTASISINASETLENGMTVSGSLGFDNLVSDQGVTGKNVVLALSGDFGRVDMQALDTSHAQKVRGIASVGAPVNNMETEVLTNTGDVARVAYTLPAFGAVTVSVDMVQALDMGEGDDTASQGVAAQYKANGLTVMVDYASWQDNSGNDNRTRMAVAYDMGQIAFGYGVSNVNMDGGAELNETVAGVRFDASDVTSFGAVYTSTESADANSKRDGYTLGLSHDISGNLNLSANYSAWESATTANSDATKSNVVLSYSF